MMTSHVVAVSSCKSDRTISCTAVVPRLIAHTATIIGRRHQVLALLPSLLLFRCCLRAALRRRRWMTNAGFSRRPLEQDVRNDIPLCGFLCSGCCRGTCLRRLCSSRTDEFLVRHLHDGFGTFPRRRCAFSVCTPFLHWAVGDWDSRCRRR